MTGCIFACACVAVMLVSVTVRPTVTLLPTGKPITTTRSSALSSRVRTGGGATRTSFSSRWKAPLLPRHTPEAQLCR